jgi:hypothetical protein
MLTVERAENKIVPLGISLRLIQRPGLFTLSGHTVLMKLNLLLAGSWVSITIKNVVSNEFMAFAYTTN